MVAHRSVMKRGWSGHFRSIEAMRKPGHNNSRLFCHIMSFSSPLLFPSSTTLLWNLFIDLSSSPPSSMQIETTTMGTESYRQCYAAVVEVIEAGHVCTCLASPLLPQSMKSQERVVVARSGELCDGASCIHC